MEASGVAGSLEYPCKSAPARLVARSKHSNDSFSALTAVPGDKASQLMLTGLADFDFIVTPQVHLRRSWKTSEPTPGIVANSKPENEGQMTEPVEPASPNKHSLDTETNVPRGTRILSKGTCFPCTFYLNHESLNPCPLPAFSTPGSWLQGCPAVICMP